MASGFLLTNSAMVFTVVRPLSMLEEVVNVKGKVVPVLNELTTTP
jgi:hypothetical protein